MPAPDAFDTIETLAKQGRLRLVYVLAVPRSNSTIVCRLLGEHLDGAVFEPALPNSGNPARHYARTILDGWRSAHARVGDGRPVVLAVKDLDGFLDDRMFEFALKASEHVVFTLRDPLMQQASLSRRFVDEFSPIHRLKISLRHPIEEHHFLWNTVGLLPRFWRLTRGELGRRTQMLRAAVAGFNYLSWRAQEHHLAAAVARLGRERVTVLDAALMRLDPEATLDQLAAIAAATPAAPETPDAAEDEAEFAGHTRMTPSSHWAREALASSGVKPLGETERFPLEGAAAAFAHDVAATLYAQYARTVLDPVNRQLRRARDGIANRQVPAGLRAVLEASDPDDAVRRLSAR